MEKTYQNFQDSVHKLDLEIRERYKTFETATRKIIVDGIVNMDDYFKSPIKIMWLLKEPYCDKLNGGGGWSICKGLNDERALGKKKDCQSTWHPIIYTTNGILNEYKRYHKMTSISDEMNLVLRKIAFINLQKLPAMTRTNDNNLRTILINNKVFIDIVLKQINVYSPDIIIGGNTLHLIKNFLNVSKDEELGFGHFKKNKQLFINTMHPGQTKITRQEYVNKIIERADNWKQVYEKTQQPTSGFVQVGQTE